MNKLPNIKSSVKSMNGLDNLLNDVYYYSNDTFFHKQIFVTEIHFTSILRKFIEWKIRDTGDLFPALHIGSFNFEWDQLLVAAERRSPLCLHRRSIFQANHFPKTIYTIHHKFCAKMINSAAPKWGMEATTTNSFRQNTKKKQQYLISIIYSISITLKSLY